MEPTTFGTVLVVEDDRATREMVVTLLNGAGFRAVAVEDGLEALHMLRAVRHREPKVPCLVLLDLSMPRLGGREFRRAQLADPVVADVPVALMTGADNVDAVSPGLGVVAAIAKPLDLGLLLRIVRQHCVGTSDTHRHGPDAGVRHQSA